MIIKGGLKFRYSDCVWKSTFKTEEEQKKAETILDLLDGMSIESARGLLTKCGQILEGLIICRDE